MSAANRPEDTLTRLVELERRVAALERGPLGDTSYPVNIRSTTGLGTKHEGASTPAPTDGSSGDIRVGTSKIWVKDGGTWKSVAVA